MLRRLPGSSCRDGDSVNVPRVGLPHINNIVEQVSTVISQNSFATDEEPHFTGYPISTGTEVSDCFVEDEVAGVCTWGVFRRFPVKDPLSRPGLRFSSNNSLLF